MVLKEFYDYAQKDAEDYVGSLIGEAKNLGVTSARWTVVRAVSSPASAIVDETRSEGADLIVIGTRGLNLSKRLLLAGSVSIGVVSNSDVQVLVVR